MVTLGMHANNDPSEGNFVMFTDILCSGGHIKHLSGSGIGQMRYNKDMVWCHEQFAMGRRGGAKSDSPNKVGTFICFPLN